MIPEYMEIFHKNWLELSAALSQLTIDELRLLSRAFGTSSDSMIDGIYNPDGKKYLVRDMIEKLREFRMQQDQLERLNKAITVLNQRGLVSD